MSRKCARIIPKIFPIEIKVINDVNSANDENGTNWIFLDWLSYVTESINQTMQFDNYGIVNTLRFFIPEVCIKYELYKKYFVYIIIFVEVFSLLHQKNSYSV